MPKAGWIAHDSTTGRLLVHNGTEFEAYGTPVGMPLGIGGPASSGNMLTVSGDASLFTAAGSGEGHRMAINRADDTETASILFETGFEATFEAGLLGDDQFRLKALPSGGLPVTAIVVDPETGFVGIGADATERLRISNGVLRCGLHAINGVDIAGTAAMKLAFYGTGDRAAFLDFHACDKRPTNDGRLIRQSGLDGTMTLENYGTGGVAVLARNAAPVTVSTSDTERARVTSTGQVGIGTTSPTTLLDVRGAVRIGSVDAAALPAAGTAGAGSLYFVATGSGAPYLALSDGASWQRLAVAS